MQHTIGLISAACEACRTDKATRYSPQRRLGAAVSAGSSTKGKLRSGALEKLLESCRRSQTFRLLFSALLCQIPICNLAKAGKVLQGCRRTACLTNPARACLPPSNGPPNPSTLVAPRSCSHSLWRQSALSAKVFCSLHCVLTCQQLALAHK